MNYYESYSNDLNLLKKISLSHNLDEPFLVGGSVRDFLFGRKAEQISDLDITTNSYDSFRLGILYSSYSNFDFRIFEDKHIKVFRPVTQLDFSAHTLYDTAIKWAVENKSAKENQFESFSRDFTVNSMHQNFETEEIFYPTEMGLSDFKNKVIRCPVPAKIALSNDLRRIFRAITLACKYDMRIDEEIINFTKEQKNIFSQYGITQNYITMEIDKAMMHNESVAFGHIVEMGLFKEIPLSGLYGKYLLSKKLIGKYLS